MKPYSRHLPLVYTLLILSAFVAACSSLELVEKDRPAIEHYLDGIREFSKGNWTNAILSFEQVTMDYPFSQYNVPAELKIAEAHFFHGDYPEALLNIQNFQDLHPTNPNIPYLLFLKGETYFRQSLKVNRDPTYAENAARVYEGLIKRFPRSTYAGMAGKRLVSARAKLAGHQLSIGRFYYRAGQYEPAISRLEPVLSEYPDFGEQDRVLYYLAKSYFFSSQRDLALETFTELCDEYGGETYCTRAEPFMADLRGDRLVPIGRARRFKERIGGWFGYE